MTVADLCKNEAAPDGYGQAIDRADALESMLARIVAQMRRGGVTIADLTFEDREMLDALGVSVASSTSLQKA